MPRHLVPKRVNPTTRIFVCNSSVFNSIKIYDIHTTPQDSRHITQSLSIIERSTFRPHCSNRHIPSKQGSPSSVELELVMFEDIHVEPKGIGQLSDCHYLCHQKRLKLSSYQYICRERRPKRMEGPVQAARGSLHIQHTSKYRLIRT